MRAPSLVRIFLAGLILAGLPFVAIAQHWHIASKDARFEILTELTLKPDAANVEITSEITQLDLNDLSGTNNVQRWDTVYVHMASGPGLIAYPFGISKDRPRSRRDKHSFNLRAFVTEREGDIITLRYSFDTFLPSRDMKPLLRGAKYPQTRIEVAVNSQSVARLVAVELDGIRYPYRVIEKPELKGLTK